MGACLGDLGVVLLVQWCSGAVGSGGWESHGTRSSMVRSVHVVGQDLEEVRTRAENERGIALIALMNKQDIA